MRPDQLVRLAELSEKLADKVLDEADPETWPGAGAMLAQMTQQERGDAYWCKKNAAATLSLLMRVEQVRAAREAQKPGAPGDTPDIDSEIAKAERQAQKLLDDALTKAGKKAFDERVHGKKR